MQNFYKDYIPKSLICFREGYSKNFFFNDLFAGVSVGIIALPLALAFAIASGVSPEKGLFTAIVAGFLISFLGGSRVQIGGPTGAFVVIVYAIVQKHGPDGLALATLIAAILMILMGIFRFGAFLRFIPYPVTTGFTTGIAVVIFVGQIKDFFGLDIAKMPPEFLDKCGALCRALPTFNVWAFVMALFTLTAIFIFRRVSPKFPGAILAIIGATLISSFFHLPLDTIESKFGEIPKMLPTPAFPAMSWELVRTVFPDAVTIAMLGAIESLLSAVVADGMTGHKHRSNGELAAQGLANIGSVIFGGIPATGAIARTSANIKLGAKTPVAGMIHAATLLILMLFLAPLAGKIPLAALSGVLIFVAWNMAEIPHFLEILWGKRGDAFILLLTFLLTVLIDLTVAVQVGVIVSAVIFLKRMTDKTTIEICKNLEEDAPESDSNLLLRKDIPNDTVVFEIRGPFFYSVADLLDEALAKLDKTPRVFVLSLSKTPLIDATGLNSIKKFNIKCGQRNIIFCIADFPASKKEMLLKAGLTEKQLFKTIDKALKECDDSTS